MALSLQTKRRLTMLIAEQTSPTKPSTGNSQSLLLPVDVCLLSDGDASFLEEYKIDVEKLEPLVAAPHSPDNRKTARECAQVTDPTFPFYLQSPRWKSIAFTLVLAPVAKPKISSLLHNSFTKLVDKSKFQPSSSPPRKKFTPFQSLCPGISVSGLGRCTCFASPWMRRQDSV